MRAEKRPHASSLPSLLSEFANAIEVNDQLTAVAELRRLDPHSFAGLLPCRMAVLAGYTSRFLVDLLYGNALLAGLNLQVMESLYGLYEQMLLAEDPQLIGFKPTILYFCVGFENLRLDSVDSEYIRWKTLWEKARSLLGCDIILNNFIEPNFRIYGNHELKVPRSAGRMVTELNLRIASEAPSYVHIHDVQFLAGAIGRDHFIDPKWYALSKIPTSMEFLPRYAQNLASILRALTGKSKKCLVLDLDNTLWGGSVGNDGVDGISLGADSAEGESYLNFQRYLKSLSNRGVILAVCSKNDEAVARSVFEKRPEMILKLTDIAKFVANWAPKDEGIRTIASELSLHPSSMVFVDDSPAERERIRQTFPDVEVLELPGDPAEFCRALSAAAFFETAHVTQEDRSRTASYQAEAQRASLKKGTASYDEYLQSLEMVALVRDWGTEDVPRVTQLLNKTNQFNLTGHKYLEAAIAKMASDTQCIHKCLHLKDRFLDYGLVSVFIANCRDSGVCEIENWVMSCRVFKRNLEPFFFEIIQHDLVRRGIHTIKGRFLATERNGYTATLYQDLGFTPQNRDFDEGPVWILKLGKAQKKQTGGFIRLGGV